MFTTSGTNNRMILNRFKYISFILFYLFSVGILSAGDNQATGSNPEVVGNAQPQRRSVLTLSEFRDSLDEVINENKKVVTLEDDLGKRTRERDAAVQKLKQERQKTEQAVHFLRYLVNSYDPSVMYFLNKRFSPGANPAEIQEARKEAEFGKFHLPIKVDSLQQESVSGIIRLIKIANLEAVPGSDEVWETRTYRNHRTPRTGETRTTHPPLEDLAEGIKKLFEED